MLKECKVVKTNNLGLLLSTEQELSVTEKYMKIMCQHKDYFLFVNNAALENVYSVRFVELAPSTLVIALVQHAILCIQRCLLQFCLQFDCSTELKTKSMTKAQTRKETFGFTSKETIMAY